jgi:ferredoxin-nitrite reductase
MANKGFTGTQKQYLEGLASGLRVARGTTRSILADVRSRMAPAGVGLLPLPLPEPEPARHPDQAMWDAQDRYVWAGQRLAPEEKAKRRQPPHELWSRIAELARERRFPGGDEVFLFKFHGLFYVSPVEEAFMCRLRFAGGQVQAYQLRGVADLAERHGHPFLQVTTRSNLQLRGLGAEAALDVLEALLDLGIISRGSGGDGVRNVGASPTAGFDRQELIDTLPLAQKAHHRILSDRSLQGVPRKFTLAFDGGGSVSPLAESCDLGFRAVTVPPGEGVAPGVYFRLTLGGATSHARYARDAGVLVAPERCLEVLEHVLRIYIEHGDRTNRRRARLVYLLETWGMPRFVAELQARLTAAHSARDGLPADDVAASDDPASDAGAADLSELAARSLMGEPSSVRGERQPAAALPELGLERCLLPAHPDPFGHVGIHNQKPRGESYIGVVLEGAQLTVAQARGLAQVADDFGRGELRLTPHQNILLPGVRDTQLHKVKEALARLGLSWACSGFRSRLVACTGSAGCQFAMADTKRLGEELVRHLEEENDLDHPLSIHISGCHHACAQHTTADIGLCATRDPGAEGGESYQLWLGGEASVAARFAQKYAASVPAAEVSRLVHEVVDAYLTRRLPDETFREFVGRAAPRELDGAQLGSQARGEPATDAGGGA